MLQYCALLKTHKRLEICTWLHYHDADDPYPQHFHNIHAICSVDDLSFRLKILVDHTFGGEKDFMHLYFQGHRDVPSDIM